MTCRLIDFVPARPNNPAMARPEAVRRVKSYSAATGYVYQYYFYEVQKSRRGLATGTEEYAVAKMRLFQAFDEVEDLATARPELLVDESNLEALLARLDL